MYFLFSIFKLDTHGRYYSHGFHQIIIRNHQNVISKGHAQRCILFQKWWLVRTDIIAILKSLRIINIIHLYLNSIILLSCLHSYLQKLTHPHVQNSWTKKKKQLSPNNKKKHYPWIARWIKQESKTKLYLYKRGIVINDPTNGTQYIMSRSSRRPLKDCARAHVNPCLSITSAGNKGCCVVSATGRRESSYICCIARPWHGSSSYRGIGFPCSRVLRVYGKREVQQICPLYIHKFGFFFSKRACLNAF